MRADATEYDPSKPNDFEEVQKVREMQRREAEVEVDRQERLKRDAEQLEVKEP